MSPRLLTGISAAFLLPALWAEERWVRLQSANFEVLTNAGAATGRETVRRFEQIRHVFEARTGKRNLSPLPVRIFVFKSEGEFRPFQINTNAAGYYQPGPSRDYIAMHASGPDTYRVVFHEYVHLVFRHAGVPVPTWFNEGSAELYSTADFHGEEIRIGDLIPRHLSTLRSERMLDIGMLMGVDHNSAHYNEQGKTGIFYAQSWALVHMFNFSAAYQPGMANFMEMLLSGEPHESALRRAFGKGEADVLADLREYVSRDRFVGLRLRTAKLELGRLIAEPVSPTDASFALADLLLAIRKTGEAARIYEALVKEQPKSPEAEAAMAALEIQRKQEMKAMEHFSRAIRLGSKSARVHFDYAMMRREAGAPLDEVLALLHKAVALEPDLFDAHHLIGYLTLREKRYGEAIESLKRATDLQPMRAAVWEYLALAYHYNGDRDRARDAVRNARRVATSPEDVSRIEATIDLVEKEPGPVVRVPNVETPILASNKPFADGGPPPGPELRGLKGDSKAEGSITQIDCLGRMARLHVFSGGRKIFLLVRDPSWVVMRNAGSATFEFACGPVPARLAALDYKTNPDSTYMTAGDVTAIELR